MVKTKRFLKSKKNDRAQCAQGRSNPDRVFNPRGRTTVASRKSRPVMMNQSMHITMRSDVAKGRFNLYRHERRLNTLIKAIAISHGVHIYKMANAGNHIHIHLRIRRRILWKGFISGLMGGIVRAVGYRRTMHNSDGTMTVGRAFWSARPHSRVVWPGRDFNQLNDYITLNQLEAAGVVPPRKSMRKGKSWRKIVELFRYG